MTTESKVQHDELGASVDLVLARVRADASSTRLLRRKPCMGLRLAVAFVYLSFIGLRSIQERSGNVLRSMKYRLRMKLTSRSAVRSSARRLALGVLL